MKLFNKNVDDNINSLKARIRYNEEYILNFTPDTQEYDIIQQVLLRDYEEIRKMEESRVKAKDILPWLTLAVTAVAGIVVPVYGMNKAYKSEEEEGKLKNGTVFNLATKNMKH